LLTGIAFFAISVRAEMAGLDVPEMGIEGYSTEPMPD